jgi:hypothetical protein
VVERSVDLLGDVRVVLDLIPDVQRSCIAMRKIRFSTSLGAMSSPCRKMSRMNPSPSRCNSAEAWV